MVARGPARRAPQAKSAAAFWLAAAALLALTQAASARIGAASTGLPAQRGAPARAQTLASYGTLSLAFVANAGQADARVRYQARAGGASFSFTRTKAVFAFSHGERGVALELAFLGANRFPLIEGAGEQPGRVNFLIGKHRANWRIGLRTYQEIVYRELWPGIDLAFRGDAGTLKYEFRLAPGADVSDIRLGYRGAERLLLDPSGELRIHTPLGVLRDSAPVSYQVQDGMRVPVESAYTLTPNRTAYGFLVRAYDATRPLVIDPGIVYSTFLGGSGTDFGNAIAVDAGGNAYVTGVAGLFPTTSGAFDTTHNGGGTEAFVAKLNADGSALVYATYLGGSVSDEGFGIAVDVDGSAIVTGRTNSSNFPTSPGAFDTSHNGSNDAFVTKLDPSGSALVYSTYLGAFGSDWGTGIAVDAAGNAYVTGQTDGPTFPTTPGAFDTTFASGADAFVTKLDPGGSVLYSTLLGGIGGELGGAIAVDASGNAYVAGAAGPFFPTTVGAFDTTHNGAFDVTVTKLNPAGSALVYSTYIGGSAHDQPAAIAIDAAGNAFVTGHTSSPAFPTTLGAFDMTFNGGVEDPFVTKLNSTGSALVYSTLLGGGESGTSNDRARGIAVDDQGSAIVTGFTADFDFPTTADALDASINGGNDGFVTKLDPTGSALTYSTFLGGAFDDRGLAIALDAAGNAYVTGTTQSSFNFPITPGAADTTFNGTFDVFVTKLAIAALPGTLTLSPASAVNAVGEPHCVTATVTDQFGNPVSDVSVVFSVSGANTAEGSATTDASGQGSFCYTGTVAGEDTIAAFVDTGGDGGQDPDELFASAAKTYVVAAPATLTLSPPSAVSAAGVPHCVTATVADRFGNRVSGVSVVFFVTGANAAAGAAPTGVNGQASYCYTGTVAGGDAIVAFADADGDSVHDADEPFGSAINAYVAAAPASLTLSPATDTNPVGTMHSVMATAADAFNNAVGQVIVRFSVTGSVSASAECTTGANGACDFAYPGPEFPGADLVSAFADTDGDGVRDEDEPVGEASKSWILPTSTPGHASGGGNFQFADARIAFGFSARNGDKGVHGKCSIVDRAADVMVDCVDVAAFIISDNVVTVYGNATVNGAATTYRIEAADNARRGRGADTFSIQTAGGYARSGTLAGGNVRVE